MIVAVPCYKIFYNPPASSSLVLIGLSTSKISHHKEDKDEWAFWTKGYVVRNMKNDRKCPLKLFFNSSNALLFCSIIASIIQYKYTKDEKN